MRQSKDFAHLNCKLEKTVNEKLLELCEKTSLSKTAAVERAINEYYEKVKTTGKV